MRLLEGGHPNRFAQRLFAPLPPRYDRLAEVLSLGQNGRRRRAPAGMAVDRASAHAATVSAVTRSCRAAQPDRRGCAR
jgi:hypothetical protein